MDHEVILSAKSGVLTATFYSTHSGLFIEFTRMTIHIGTLQRPILVALLFLLVGRQTMAAVFF